MRKMFTRLLACALALLLALPAASLAEFSPRLNALKEKDGMTLEITGKYTSLEKLSKDTLKAVNEWLEKARLTVEGRLGGQMSGVTVEEDGEALFSFVSQQQEGGIVTVFKPSGDAYLTGADQKSAIELLTGESTFVLDPAELTKLYEKLARALYPVLDTKTEPKVQKTRTSVKNAAASTSYVDYVFKAEAMNEIWPDVLDAIVPALQDALKDQPEISRRVEALLKDLVFTGECRFKRLREKENGDMGLQFTGVAGRENDQRRVTIFGGYTADKGGYLSIKMPAVKGKNNLTVQLSLSQTQAKSGTRTLKVDGSYKRRMDDVTESGTLKVNLRNTVKNDDERWSGTVTASQTKDGVKTTYTFKPDLKFTAEGLAGPIAVQRSVKGKTNMKATVQVSLKEAVPAELEGADTAQDLRGMSEKEAQAAVREELPELIQVVARWMAELPEDVRALLTHELRTDAWMNMTAADVADEEAEAPDEEAADEGDDGEADAPDDEEKPEDAGDENETAANEPEWEDADDDGNWPAVGAAEQKEPEGDQPASGQPTAPQTQDDDDWFGDDWFGDDITVEGTGNEEEGDE